MTTRLYWAAVGRWVAATSGVTGTRRDEDDRGDVPGWVMITLMSALMIAVLMGVFRQQLQDAFNWAINHVQTSDPQQ